MIRKEYQKPTMKVMQLQHQCHILAGSMQKTTTNLDGWDSDGYDKNGGNQDDAW